ncbi:MAG: RND family efflux transporter MFP subunit [Cryomorphaceae bacterium]|jgi:RND family efflux transporter MFP subunit
MKNFLFKFIPIIAIILGTWVGVSYLSKPTEEDKKKKSAHQKQSNSKAKSGMAGKTGNKNPNRRRRGQQTTADLLTSVDFPVELITQGTVKTKTSSMLNALVSGRVISISPKFQDGAFFQKGEVLVELDPADFQSQIITVGASLARAEASLIQEEARAAQALRNWQDIGFDEEPNDLVLRKPQLREAEANVAAQQASLGRAKRNLDRASIKAPINGRVRRRIVGPGQSVGASTNLGEIYATDSAEIRLPLSSRQLEQITIDEQGNQSIPVTLTDAINSNNKTIWKANIKHVEGELDASSRELFVIAHIADPFGIISNSPPLRINQPVSAIIMGNKLKGAYIIDRKYLYGADEIILIEDDQIQRKKINIVWTTLDSVITQDPELEGKTIATSRLGFATDGSPVEIIIPEGLSPENPEVKKEDKNNKGNRAVRSKRSGRL